MWAAQRRAAVLRRRKVAAPAFSFVNGEAAAFVARLTTAPSILYKAAYDTLFGRLKSGRLNGSNLLGAFDVFYVRAAPDAQAALLNLAGTSYTATLSSNPPPFHAGYGFTANGIDSYVEWGGWAPSAGVQYTRNSACFGFWGRRVGGLTQSSGTADAGASAGATTGNPWIMPRTSANNTSYRLNDATTSNAASGVTDGSGLYVAVRTDGATRRLYRNGAQLGSDAAVASTAPGSAAIREGHAFAAYAQNQLPFAFAGRALTSNEVADLYDALGEYLAAIGWQPLIVSPSGDANIRAAAITTTAAYTARVGLPDAVPTVVAGKGFTCTGLARDPRDGTWWVSAFGRNAQGDTSSTAKPYLVHLDGDRATVLGTIDLVAIGLAVTTLQGIAFDSSDNTLFFVGGGSIYHVAASTGASALIGSAITGQAANGLAYDSKRDKLVVGSTGGSLAYVNKDGTTTGLPSLGAGVPGSYVDQLAYAADLDAFLVTGGPNGADGLLSLVGWGQNYGALRWSRCDLLTGSTCVEGIDRTAGVLTVANDFWYHGGTGSLANSTVRYAAPY